MLIVGVLLASARTAASQVDSDFSRWFHLARAYARPVISAAGAKRWRHWRASFIWSHLSSAIGRRQPLEAWARPRRRDKLLGWSPPIGPAKPINTNLDERGRSLPANSNDALESSEAK